MRALTSAPSASVLWARWPERSFRSMRASAATRSPVSASIRRPVCSTSRISGARDRPPVSTKARSGSAAEGSIARTRSSISSEIEHCVLAVCAARSRPASCGQPLRAGSGSGTRTIRSGSHASAMRFSSSWSIPDASSARNRSYQAPHCASISRNRRSSQYSNPRTSPVGRQACGAGRLTVPLVPRDRTMVSYSAAPQPAAEAWLSPSSAATCQPSSRSPSSRHIGVADASTTPTRPFEAITGGNHSGRRLPPRSRQAARRGASASCLVSWSSSPLDRASEELSRYRPPVSRPASQSPLVIAAPRSSGRRGSCSSAQGSLAAMNRASTGPTASRNVGMPLSASVCAPAKLHCQLSAGISGSPSRPTRARSCCRHDWLRYPGFERSQPSSPSCVRSSSTIPGNACRSNAGLPCQRTAPAIGMLTYPSDPSSVAAAKPHSVVEHTKPRYRAVR